jgi:hypothetical protein
MDGRQIDNAIQSAVMSAMYAGMFVGAIGVLVVQWVWPFLRVWIHWATGEGQP